MMLAACGGTPHQASAPPGRLPQPGELRGLSDSAVVALLGEPDFRRNEVQAELWQYRAEDCVLDLFLYRGDGGFRVAETATRDRGRPGPVPCRDEEAPLRARLAHLPL